MDWRAPDWHGAVRPCTTLAQHALKALRSHGAGALCCLVALSERFSWLFHGWPCSYFGQHVDTRVQPQRADLVAKALAPDYALGSHVAPLGMAFAEGFALAPQLASGALIGEHGSWNRKPLSGYKVVFVPFEKGQPSGLPVDVLTGFLSENGKAFGRPVGVAIDPRGALLVADDVGNTIWRVTGQRAP